MDRLLRLPPRPGLPSRMKGGGGEMLRGGGGRTAGRRGFQQIPGRYWERQGLLPRVAQRHRPPLRMSRGGTALRVNRFLGDRGHHFERGHGDLFLPSSVLDFMTTPPTHTLPPI